MGPRVGPRSWWVRGLTVAALVLASATWPQAASSQEGDGLLPPGDWSDEQEAELLDLIARTEAALPAFADPAELLEMGFIDFGITAPGGYDHFINWDWLDDGHVLDPNFPEALVFHVTWNEANQDYDYELVSAMFFLPSDVDMDTIPAEHVWKPGWHTHADICVSDEGTFAGLSNNGECFTGRPFVKPPMMHVWITDNECGHRFGGIDIGGLHCDVHGHPGGPGHPGPGPGHPGPGHPGPGHPDPGHPDPGHPDPHPPGQSHNPQTGHQHPSPTPAQSHHHHPNVTG